MNNHVLEVVTVAVLLLLAVTEAIVHMVERVRLTNSTDFENCTESIKLVPTIHIIPPAQVPSLPSPTLTTLSLPLTTTQPLMYPLPYATTHTTPHSSTPITATLKQLKYNTSPTLHKTLSPSLPADKYAALNEITKVTQYSDKHAMLKPSKADKSPHTVKDKPQSLTQYPESSSLSSSTSLPLPIHVTVPSPNHPPHASTLPPPAPTLPLPTVPSPPTTPTPKLELSEIWEDVSHLLRKRIPLVLPSEYAQHLNKSYLERIRKVNHEMVDKLLQAEYDEEESTGTSNGGSNPCQLPEKRLAHLAHLKKILLLLMQALPQTMEEVEEAAWNPEITDYIFRPERKAVFDVYGCRQCYALDASGVCREMFYCKDGEDVFYRTTVRRPVG